jgi:HEAT repeat protein
MGTNDILPQIISDLRSADFDRRRLAIRDLTVSDIDVARKVRLLNDALDGESDIQLKYELRKSINEIQSLLNKPVSDKRNQENFKNLQKAFQSGDKEIVNRAFLYAVENRMVQCLPETIMIESYSGDSFHKICNIRLMLTQGTAYFKHILGYLDDEDPRVIATSIEALELIGNTTAFASIARFTNHEHNRVRASAIKALQNLGDEKAYLLFARMIQSPYSAYRDSAAFALSQLKLEQSVEFLSLLLLDEVESVRAKALSALEQMAKSGDRSAAKIIHKLDTEQPFSLWSQELMNELAASFKEFRTPGSTPAALNSDIKEFRLLALKALCQNDTDESAEIIINRLKLEKDAKVIASAVIALGRAKGNKEQIRHTLKAFLSHKNDRVRANAIEAYCQVTDKAERGDLLPYLDDPCNRVAGNAIVGLYGVLRKKSRKALENMASSGNRLYELTAVYCIGELADPDLCDIAESLLNSKHSDVAEKIESVLELYKNVSPFERVLRKHRKNREDFS